MVQPGNLPPVFLYRRLHTHVNGFCNFLREGGGAKSRDAGEAGHVRFAPRARRALDFPRGRCTLVFQRHRAMGTSCQIAGCKNDTPPALAEQRLCVLHFTLALETSCSEMRRETAL